MKGGMVENFGGFQNFSWRWGSFWCRWIRGEIKGEDLVKGSVEDYDPCEMKE